MCVEAQGVKPRHEFLQEASGLFRALVFQRKFDEGFKGREPFLVVARRGPPGLRILFFFLLFHFATHPPSMFKMRIKLCRRPNASQYIIASAKVIEPSNRCSGGRPSGGSTISNDNI